MARRQPNIRFMGALAEIRGTRPLADGMNAVTTAVTTGVSSLDFGVAGVERSEPPVRSRWGLVSLAPRHPTPVFWLDIALRAFSDARLSIGCAAPAIDFLRRETQDAGVPMPPPGSMGGPWSGHPVARCSWSSVG